MKNPKNHYNKRMDQEPGTARLKGRTIAIAVVTLFAAVTLIVLFDVYAIAGLTTAAIIAFALSNRNLDSSARKQQTGKYADTSRVATPATTEHHAAA